MAATRAVGAAAASQQERLAVAQIPHKCNSHRYYSQIDKKLYSDGLSWVVTMGSQKQAANGSMNAASRELNRVSFASGVGRRWPAILSSKSLE